MEGLRFAVCRAELTVDFAGHRLFADWERLEDADDELPSALPPGVWWVQVFDSGRAALPAHPNRPALTGEIAAWVSEQLGELEGGWPWWGFGGSDLDHTSLRLDWCISAASSGVLWIHSETVLWPPHLVITVHMPATLSNPAMDTVDRAWANVQPRLIGRPPSGRMTLTNCTDIELREVSSAGAPEQAFQIAARVQLDAAAQQTRGTFTWLAGNGDGLESRFYTAVERLTQDQPYESTMLVEAPARVARLTRTVEDYRSGLPRLPRIGDAGASALLRTGVEHLERVRAETEIALSDLVARLTSSLAGINGSAIMAQLLQTHAQLVEAQRQSEAAERRADEAGRLQSLAAVVATVFVVPSLVAAVYAADVATPARGSADGLIALISLMVCGGTVASLVVAWMNSSGDTASGRSGLGRFLRTHSVRVGLAAVLLVATVAVSAARPIRSLTTSQPASHPATHTRR